jgi:tight adherence protein B
MTGPVLTATALSAALLVVPSSSRGRLGYLGANRMVLSRHTRRTAMACAAVGGIVILPLTTIFAAVVLSLTWSLRSGRRRRSDRARAESAELETAIDVLVGELRVGAHPATAFAVAAEEATGAVAGACRAVAARARMGADVAAGLRSVAETSASSSNWHRLAVCWQLASDHGLAMSALMRTAQRDIAERQRFSSQVRSAMAGARATATILAGLPVLSVLMGQLIGAHPLAFLLGGGPGGWLLTVGLTLVCAGLLWSDRITDQAVA